ncbi:MAG: pilus assembly protein PilM [Deltaproteobacteria bacterium]|nr:pilus assembly protein PilM [Deltaproteobacteria bacterium]
MAHRILGLDIGTRAIRLAIADKSLRQTALTGWDEEPVAAPDPEQPAHHRHPLFSPEQVAAVQTLLLRNQRPDDVVAVAMPATYVMHRVLAFPFRDDQAIAEAVGFELENHIPTPISDVVVDFVRLGEKEGQTEVLALAAPRDIVVKHIDAYKEMGIEARRLGLQSLAYAHLVRKLPDAKEGVTLLIDVGTRSSEVLVCQDGKAQMLRSFAVGGQTIADLFGSLVQSELQPADLLRGHAVLLPDEALETDQERGLALATRQAVQPLLRELRLTLANWLRRSHKRPDRVLLTGWLAELGGIHEFIERSLDVPVKAIELGNMPDVRLASAHDLGDRGALAVALALAAADTESGGDVDFRQGELAYEGDFKVLRQRLPQLVAFIVVALCLLGIRASLNYRALVIEQEQQLAILQALSKQLTGKASTDFETVRKELAREPAVDMAALYPDISAFKVLEDVSGILDKVTEPPDFKPPGGPEEEAAPQPPPGMVVPPGVAGIPAHRLPTVDAVRKPPRGAGHGRGGSATGDDSATEAAPSPSVPGGAPPAGPGNPDPSAKDEGKGLDPAAPFTGHKVELAAVQIERGRATLRGDADTQDAILALQQAVDAHKCFSKVKSSSDRITFERHRDWFKFTLEFEIACPVEADKAKKDKAAKADAEADKADGEGDEK